MPLEELPDVPYVCLRLPTGGGKTILAAHAVSVARNGWVEKDHPLVLWLVPTNTIRRQTVDALKEATHEGILVRDSAEGKVEIAITGWIDDGREKAICETLHVSERTAFACAVCDVSDRRQDPRPDIRWPSYASTRDHAQGIPRPQS